MPNNNDSKQAGRSRLLLHCCCAPCASSVIERLRSDFEITAFFCNPNIYPREEHDMRRAELARFLALAQYADIDMIDGGYDADLFAAAAMPFEAETEGGRRCAECFRIRLDGTAKYAKTGGYDCFATTLSVSPHKNAALINEIGGKAAEMHGVEYLHSDFKKQDGYKRSVELARQFGLYRQAYCGCRWSVRD